MSFDISKPYACRNGLPASAIRHPGVGCEHLAIGTYTTNNHNRAGLWALNNGGKWAGDDSSHGGCQQEDHPLDLVNVPETRTVKVWLTLEKDGDVSAEPARPTGQYLTRRVIATREVELTFTIGEGLGEKP